MRESERFIYRPEFSTYAAGFSEIVPINQSTSIFPSTIEMEMIQKEIATGSFGSRNPAAWIFASKLLIVECVPKAPCEAGGASCGRFEPKLRLASSRSASTLLLQAALKFAEICGNSGKGGGRL